jgi:hypothetical protein
MSGGHTPEQVFRFERELAADAALVARVLATVPPAPEEPKRVLIRCSRENADRAIARALARAVVFCELSTVEIVRELDVSNTENS